MAKLKKQICTHIKSQFNAVESEHINKITNACIFRLVLFFLSLILLYASPGRTQRDTVEWQFRVRTLCRIANAIKVHTPRPVLVKTVQAKTSRSNAVSIYSFAFVESGDLIVFRVSVKYFNYIKNGVATVRVLQHTR